MCSIARRQQSHFLTAFLYSFLHFTHNWTIFNQVFHPDITRRGAWNEGPGVSNNSGSCAICQTKSKYINWFERTYIFRCYPAIQRLWIFRQQRLPAATRHWTCLLLVSNSEDAVRFFFATNVVNEHLFTVFL